MRATIYRLDFKGCELVYVGQTLQPLEVRIRQHVFQMRAGRHHCKKVQAAYVRFGLPCYSELEAKDFDVFIDDLGWDYLTLLLAKEDDFDEYGDLLWDNPAFIDDHDTLIQRLSEAGSAKEWLNSREAYWIGRYAPLVLNTAIPSQ